MTIDIHRTFHTKNEWFNSYDITFLRKSQPHFLHRDCTIANVKRRNESRNTGSSCAFWKSYLQRKVILVRSTLEYVCQHSNASESTSKGSTMLYVFFQLHRMLQKHLESRSLRNTWLEEGISWAKPKKETRKRRTIWFFLPLPLLLDTLTQNTKKDLHCCFYTKRPWIKGILSTKLTYIVS